jgi:hypothetical protein
MYRWYVCRARRHHWQKEFDFCQEKWKRQKKEEKEGKEGKKKSREESIWCGGGGE